MSTDRSFKTHSEDELAETTNEPGKTRENPGREVPGASKANDSHNYQSATVKSTARTLRRTGLRRVEEHASRHDVRAACHCGPEGHE
jgi:hypothetical protein